MKRAAFLSPLFGVLFCLCFLPPTVATEFHSLVLDEQFSSEGAAVADFNGDGHLDVVSGTCWYAGPDFQRSIQIVPRRTYPIAGYSDAFFHFTADFNQDGRPDVLTVPMPGTPAFWYANPGTDDQTWQRFPVLDDVSNESPAFLDITGDGQPELICLHHGNWGYAQPDPAAPGTPWRFTQISNDRQLGRFTHGLGVGDINGDGRADLLEKSGWWEQPETAGQLFHFHAWPFAASGGSQMFAWDFDGDGDNDVVSVQNAHSWGLAWFEQRQSNDSIGFIRHDILPDAPSPEAPVNLSQMHALALADMDNDGLPDLVTGKRFYAHGGKDPGAQQLPVLYYFRTIREAGTVRFEPHLISPRAGVGTQLTVADMDEDGDQDIVVGNKLGTRVLLNPGRSPQPARLSDALRSIGTSEYAQAIRSTEPLTPEQERATFVLPEGFAAELVVSEPTIAKPMNLAFDHRGRLWITSSQEYPFAAGDDRPGQDSIVVLEDTDGDGHRETATTFADGLNIPIGLYPYQDGVICFSIPHIWFLRDTDGDGRADKRTKLYGPMGFERDTHGMCNSFTRGLDGWLYACHGFNNHTTVAGRDGHEVRMQSGNIFRMQLDGSRVEHFTHGLVNPFGMSQTPDGDLLVADCHTKPVSLLLPGGYYESFGKPHDGLGFVPPVMTHLHGSTAIGGLAYSSHDSFPDAYRNNTFGGNVMTGRINRNSLQPRGSGYRAQEEPDLLIAGDAWFRPVDLQFGPDGALYVADFYNRIIGHYEVDLKHPGRDRKRGRVWKISYQGTPSDDAPSDSTDSQTPQQLFAQLQSSNSVKRQLAMDRLIDRFPKEAVSLARGGTQHPAESVRQHSLWILHRVDDLSPNLLAQLQQDPAEQVRNSVFRVVADRPSSTFPTDLFTAGFHDPAPRVRRAAVQAASVHAQVPLGHALLDLYRHTTNDNVHLQHAIRMALRNHWRDSRQFEHDTRTPESALIPVIGSICLALDAPEAGRFLVRHIRQLSQEPPQQFARLVRFAVRHVEADSVAELVAVTRDVFRNDPDFQRQLLRSAVSEVRKQRDQVPPAIHQWGIDLVSELLQLQDGRLPGDRVPLIPWTWTPLPGHNETENPFVVTRRRRSQDGQQKTALYSSFPRGEQRTGIFRSGAFELTESLQFYMAGHDGFPDQPAGQKNRVQLRDATTHKVLQTWNAPRNDVAQIFTWKPSASRSVYLEIVDGDAAGAFAWLAVGRFSIDGLNPGQQRERTTQAIQLVGELKLHELQGVLQLLIPEAAASAETAASVAKALSQLQPNSKRRSLAAACRVLGLAPELRRQTLQQLEVNTDPPWSALLPVLQVATTREQHQIAAEMVSDRSGCHELLRLAEQGAIAEQLLQDSALQAAVRAVSEDELTTRLDTLLAELPDPDQAVQQQIQARQTLFLTQSGQASRGKALFEKNCAVCHQVAGRGKQIGPNLDGIGNRGLERLVEDTLAPSRNVDVAFRTTTVVTTNGLVLNGLARDTAGQPLVLVDTQGRETTVARADIDEQIQSRRSLMPDNVASGLSDEEFCDLMAWLLSLRH